MFPGDSEGKPRPEHLQTRAEYLLKNLNKLISKSPTKTPKKKGKRDRKAKKDQPDLTEYFEEKPAKSTRKKRESKKKEKEVPVEVEEEPVQDEPDCSEIVFKKVS